MSLRELTEANGELPPTVEVRTGGGGRHVYFRMPDDVDVRNSVDLGGLPGLDVRGTGGYVLLPPSDHASGNLYAWIRDPESTRLAEAPGWLLEMMHSAHSAGSHSERTDLLRWRIRLRVTGIGINEVF